MTHIETCLDTLRHLITAGDPNGISLGEEAIEEYWAATPQRARKSGLLYIQQILQDRRNTLSRESRDFADTVDACFERKLGGPVSLLREEARRPGQLTSTRETVRFTCASCGTQYEATREQRPVQLSGRFDCEECGRPLCIWTGYYELFEWHAVRPRQT